MFRLKETSIYRGALLMLISALCFTVMNIQVKFLKNLEYSAYQLVFFRSLGSFMLTLGYLWYHKIDFKGSQPKLLWARGIVGVTSMLLYFKSMSYLPIGTAVSLRYVSPIFAVIWAVLFLKEKIKAIQWLYFFTAFLGVLCIKGVDADVPLIGVLLVLISAFFGGLVFVLISKIGKKDHPVVIINYFMGIATLIGLLLSYFDWKTPLNLQELLMLFSLGVFGYFGQLLMTKALQSEKSSVIVPLKYVEVIFTMFVGVVYFEDTYTFVGVIGTLLVIIALYLNLRTKA